MAKPFSGFLLRWEFLGCISHVFVNSLGRQTKALAQDRGRRIEAHPAFPLRRNNLCTFTEGPNH